MGFLHPSSNSYSGHLTSKTANVYLINDLSIQNILMFHDHSGKPQGQKVYQTSTNRTISHLHCVATSKVLPILRAFLSAFPGLNMLSAGESKPSWQFCPSFSRTKMRGYIVDVPFRLLFVGQPESSARPRLCWAQLRKTLLQIVVARSRMHIQPVCGTSQIEQNPGNSGHISKSRFVLQSNYFTPLGT